jgi:hypothetical protein
MPHTHWPDKKGPVCKFRTKKECDEAYVNWQAHEQVRLAASVVAQGGAKAHSKSKAVFSQVVQMLAGERVTIQNDDGTPSGAPFTRRLLTAVDEYRKEQDALSER